MRRQECGQNQRELRQLLQEKGAEASRKVATLDPDYLLSEKEEVLLEELTRGFPEPVTVDWDGVTRSKVTEATAEYHDQFERGRSVKVPASRIVLSFPTTGTLSILDYQASIFTMGPTHGTVAGSTIVLEIVERELNAEVVDNAIARLRENVDKRVVWANHDVMNLREQAVTSLQSAVAARRQRIVADRSLDEALCIPVWSSGAERQPVPAFTHRADQQAGRQMTRPGVRVGGPPERAAGPGP